MEALDIMSNRIYRIEHRPQDLLLFELLCAAAATIVNKLGNVFAWWYEKETAVIWSCPRINKKRVLCNGKPMYFVCKISNQELVMANNEYIQFICNNMSTLGNRADAYQNALMTNSYTLELTLLPFHHTNESVGGVTVDKPPCKKRRCDMKHVLDTKTKTVTVLQEQMTRKSLTADKNDGTYSEYMGKPSSNPEDDHIEDVVNFYTLMMARSIACLELVRKQYNETTMFQYFNFERIWVDIEDALVITALSELQARKKVYVTYCLHSQLYEAIMDPKTKQITQTNKNTNTTQIIRHIDNKQTLMHKALFSKAQIPFAKLDAAVCQSKYTKNWNQECKNSIQLARLAELFSSFGSQFKYISETGECNCELYVKPLAVLNWLTSAQTRGYTHVRLMAHGGTQIEYDAIREDPFGFNLRHAGENNNGAAFGTGIYFGTSDHITTYYNKVGNNGTFILALVLSLEDSNEKVGSMKFHCLPANNTRQNRYATDETRGTLNAACVYDGFLILVLGKCCAI